MSAYTEPTINIDATAIFFRRGNCNLTTSYTGMTINIKSTKMFTRQLTRTATIKLIQYPDSSFVQPVHVRRVGTQRKASTEAQVIPIEALIPISAYAK